MTETLSKQNKQKSKFSVVSLGCARSLVDSETMVDDLHKIGFELVPEGSNEAITILNTCSFIEAAVIETEKNIDELLGRKKEGIIKYLVVAGCYPGRYKRHELEEKYPDVDLWLSTKEEYQLQDKLAELVFQKRFTPKDNVPYTKLTPTHYAYLKISEGCNNWCSFCTIPKIRGEHVSRPVEDVVADAKRFIAMGVKELVIIAEDTTCWGEDLFGKPSLHILLDALGELDIPWIRLMYIFPPRVNQELVDVMNKHDNLIPYIDVPLQHVNSELLIAMNRRHDREYLEKTLSMLTTQIPKLVLRSSFILGFPGETDEHVEELIEFIQNVPFENIGCFTYSTERETKAARLQEPVSTEEARQRVDRVMKAQFELIQERNKKRCGETIEVLFEGNRIARSTREAPEVDGVIVLDQDEGLKPGSFYTVRITGQDNYDLLAEIIRD